MNVQWIAVNLPWEDPANLHGVTPPHPRPDTSDLERQGLDGLTALEAYNASYVKYVAYCRSRGFSTDVFDKTLADPVDEGQRSALLEHQARVQRIRAVEARVFETPQLIAWRQAYAEATEATHRRSFKNWLRVGMGFQTEDGRYFLVGNMDVSGNEGGCCPINTITPETRIVRYCTVNLPFDVTNT